MIKSVKHSVIAFEVIQDSVSFNLPVNNNFC